MNEKKTSKFIQFLLNPNVLFTCIVWVVTLLSIAGSIVCVVILTESVFSYFTYGFAGIGLTYSVYLVVKRAPVVKDKIIRALKSRAFTRAIMENYEFRTVVFTSASLLINLAFVAFNVALCVLNRSIWYGALSAYYLTLSLLRMGIFKAGATAKRKSAGDERAYFKSQLQNYRICGVLLFVLDIVMAGAVSLMMLQKKPTKYSEIMAIVFAAYTCYKLTFAILNIIRAKKRNDCQIQAFRNIGLADAAMSLVSLQVALIATFSNGEDGLMPLNAIMGFTVCVLSIIMGIKMIVTATKRLKELNN